MEIRDKTFLVTGGASGLGAATARRIVQSGARVLIADLDTAAGDALARELGASARFVQTDVTDEASVTRAVNAAVEGFGRLHGAVCCAGLVHAEKLLSDAGVHSLSAFDTIIRVNLIGTFNVFRLAAQAMAQQNPGAGGERGVLIATASIAAFEGQVGQTAYAASKGGVVAMTLPLARELSRYGIRAVTIAPGVFETPMIAKVKEEVRAALGQQIPFPPRPGKPEEFAALVVHVIENPMLNGEVIRLDGAMRLGWR